MTRDGIKAIHPLIEQLPDFYQNSPEVVDFTKCIYSQINSAWMQREEFKSIKCPNCNLVVTYMGISFIWN